MLPAYEKKIPELYNVQVRMCRVFGVYRYPTDDTNIKKFAYGTYSILIISWAMSYTLCVMIEFILQPTILDKIVKVVFGLATFIACTYKLVHIKCNDSLYKMPVLLLYKGIFCPVDDEEDLILDKHIKLSKYVRNSYGALSILALSFILILHKIAHPGDLPVAAYTPFGIGFVMMEMFSFPSVAFMCLINILYDTWCTSFLIFAKCQVEILGHRLKTMGEHNSDYESINRDLITCIGHHTEILKFMKAIERTMTLPVSVQMFCSVTVLCSNFYSMSIISLEDDLISFVIFFIYQMAMLMQIFLLCFFSNEVTLETLQLSFALYSSNWITWNKKNRKLMLLIMVHFDNPLFIRSINQCYCFNLTTFTSIVNSSYSYFALLKQMN